MLSKGLTAEEKPTPDQNGQANGHQENSSNQQTECGCSLAWFRTSACHVDDPGSNPGNRTIHFSFFQSPKQPSFYARADI